MNSDRRWDTERQEWVYPADWRPVSSAPKDGTRILGFGMLAWETAVGAATVRWDTFNHHWICDPNEASEYSPEECSLTHWMPLPEPPND